MTPNKSDEGTRNTAADQLRSNAEEQLLTMKKARVKQSQSKWDSERLRYELEIHQCELEMQNAELVHARDETDIALDRFTDLFESGPVGFLILNREGVIKAVSISSASLLGKNRSELVGRNFGTFVANKSQQVFADLLEKTFADRDKIVCDVTLRTDGNTPIFVQLAAKVAASGQECNVALIDITDRKLAGEALLLSEQNYHAVVDDQTELIARFLPDGTYTFVNKAHCRFFGKTEEEVVGKNWHPDVISGDALLIEEQLKVMSPENPVVVIVNRAKSCTGEISWMQFTNRGFFDGEGRLVETQAVGRDITELKRVEETLKEYSGRLIVLEEDLRERIAADLHDDIAQVLTALGLNLAHVSNHLTGESRENLIRTVDDSCKLTKQLSRSVRNLMVELHPQQLEEFGLVTALRSHVEEYANRTGIEAVVNSDLDFPRLSRQKETALFRIAQEALQNIMKHATATKATIILSSSGGVIRLTVTDNGKGFVPKAASPLPTGSGWGLTNMRERAELIGGRFRVHSVVGEGTTVEVEIISTKVAASS